MLRWLSSQTAYIGLMMFASGGFVKQRQGQI